MAAKRTLVVLPLLVIAGLLWGVPDAHAGAFVVTKTADTADGSCSPTDCSLREAIIAANIDVIPDRIVVPAGTYVRSIPGTEEDDAADGDLDILDDVEIVGAGPLATIIEGDGTASGERVFHVVDGDALLIMSGVTIRRGFAGGTQDDGGGIEADQGALALRNAIVTGNHADDSGAGINSDASDDTSRLEDSLVVGNDAGDEGGGVSLDEPILIRNTTISGNSADTDGGGIAAFGDATLSSVTIAGNTADADNTNDGGGGGIYTVNVAVEIRNTIVADNADASGGAPDCDAVAALSSVGYNLVENPSGCSGLIGTDLTGQDPRLGPLTDNGGPTSTHALLKGSPAINAGNPAAPGTGGAACEADDQRGVHRSDCDIGAYELVTCKGTPANELGTEGSDTLQGTSGPDGFLAFGGNDTVKGLGGKDAACLGPGNDTGAGGGGKDRLFGEGGKDRLKGQGGNDRLVGGPGKDTCAGGPGTKDKAPCEVTKSVP